METIRQKTPQCCGCLERIMADYGDKSPFLRPITFDDQMRIHPVHFVIKAPHTKPGIIMNFCPFCGERISEIKDA